MCHITLWESNLYKDYKDVNCREICIRYGKLFGDIFYSNKYVVTRTKLCWTGFNLFDYSTKENHKNEILVFLESTGSNDKVKPSKQGKFTSKTTGSRSGDKIKSRSNKQKGKKNKTSVCELSLSVDGTNYDVERKATKVVEPYQFR